MEEHICAKCGKSKSLNLFPIRSKSPLVYRTECKRCKQDYMNSRYHNNTAAKKNQLSATRKWMKENKESNNIYRAEWAKEDRNSNKEYYAHREFISRLNKYRTTIDWYKEKLIKQNGLCAICGHISYHSGKMVSLSVDHNHSCCDTKAKSCGKCNRGLLCMKCNMRLAGLEEVLKDAFVQPMLGKSDSWTAKALRYIISYE